ncbi:MAG: thioredoxin family protein [Methanosarcinales archaeon]|nr:thioredoxin family protein [Methanosarcinales archaeon]
MAKPILMDFTATWCGPCRLQHPIIEKMEEEYKDRIEVCVIDVDEHPELSAKYNIRVVPTVIIEKDDVILSSFTGVTPEKILRKKIDDALA